jgi:hypothetical protein
LFGGRSLILCVILATLYYGACVLLIIGLIGLFGLRMFILAPCTGVLGFVYKNVSLTFWLSRVLHIFMLPWTLNFKELPLTVNLMKTTYMGRKI